MDKWGFIVTKAIEIVKIEKVIHIHNSYQQIYPQSCEQLTPL